MSMELAFFLYFMKALLAMAWLFLMFRRLRNDSRKQQAVTAMLATILLCISIVLGMIIGDRKSWWHAALFFSGLTIDLCFLAFSPQKKKRSRQMSRLID